MLLGKVKSLSKQISGHLQGKSVMLHFPTVALANLNRKKASAVSLPTLTSCKLIKLKCYHNTSDTYCCLIVSL